MELTRGESERRAHHICGLTVAHGRGGGGTREGP
jgi:hypothetical protein